MADFKKYLTTFIILGIFMVSLLSFVFNLQVMHDVNETILDHPALKTFNSSIGTQVEGVREDLNTQQNVTEADVDSFTKLAFGDLNFASFFTMINRFISYPIDLIEGFFTLAETMLGIPAVIIGTLLSLIVFAGIIAWYRI